MTTDFWENRFKAEGKVWGGEPSNSVNIARDIFNKHGVHNVYIPGIGYGRNALFFKDKGYDVAGTEISPTAINILKEQAPDIRVKNQSALDVFADNEFFEAIYCFNVLHLFKLAERKKFIQVCEQQLKQNGIGFFVVFSEKEASYGKGQCVEENTFESKPGRPVHYFNEQDIKNHFTNFEILDLGIINDRENHGQGPHEHILRFIAVRKR